MRLRFFPPEPNVCREAAPLYVESLRHTKPSVRQKLPFRPFFASFLKSVRCAQYHPSASREVDLSSVPPWIRLFSLFIPVVVNLYVVTSGILLSEFPPFYPPSRPHKKLAPSFASADFAAANFQQPTSGRRGRYPLFARPCLFLAPITVVGGSPHFPPPVPLVGLNKWGPRSLCPVINFFIILSFHASEFLLFLR